MTTRGDELASAFDRLAGAFEIGGRDELAAVVARSGWATRPVTVPLLPSGVRHGVPWSLSISATDAAVEVRVWLEAQADPPDEAAYLSAAEAMLGPSPLIAMPQRLWHQLRFARGRAATIETYACVPDRPELAWAAAGAAGLELRAALPARALVTMIAGTRERMKVYVLFPAARPAELPYVDRDTLAFAHVLHPSDAPIGWLVAYTLAPDRPPVASLHFAAHVHGDRELPARLSGHAALVRARAALGEPRLHFVAHAPGRLNFYFLPEVAR